MKLCLEISDCSLRDSVCGGRLINTTFIRIALGCQGRVASSRAAAASGRNRSSVKSRRRCQRRDGTEGNLDGDVGAEGLHNRGAQGVLFREQRGQVMRAEGEPEGSAWASVQAPASSSKTLSCPGRECGPVQGAFL